MAKQHQSAKQCAPQEYPNYTAPATSVDTCMEGAGADQALAAQGTMGNQAVLDAIGLGTTPSPADRMEAAALSRNAQPGDSVAAGNGTEIPAHHPVVEQLVHRFSYMSHEEVTNMSPEDEAFLSAACYQKP